MNDRQNHYYKKHQEKRLAYGKSYREKNREKINEKQRKHRVEHPEKYKQIRKDYSKQYYEENKETLLQRSRKYYRDFTKINNYTSTLPSTVSIMFGAIKRRNKNKNIIIDFDKAYLQNVIDDTLIALKDLVSLIVNSPTRVSIDKLDPSQGYIKDNIQIIPAWLNYAYHDFDKNEVNEQIIKFAEYLKSKKITDML